MGEIKGPEVKAMAKSMVHIKEKKNLERQLISWVVRVCGVIQWMVLCSQWSWNWRATAATFPSSWRQMEKEQEGHVWLWQLNGSWGGNEFLYCQNKAAVFLGLYLVLPINHTGFVTACVPQKNDSSCTFAFWGLVQPPREGHCESILRQCGIIVHCQEMTAPDRQCLCGNPWQGLDLSQMSCWSAGTGSRAVYWQFSSTTAVS